MASCVSSGLVTIAASIPAARSWSVSSTQARCSPNARAARARICGSGSAPPTRRAPRPVLARFAAMALLAPRPMIPMRSSATMVPPSGECRLWASSIILAADGLCNILDKSVGTSAWADCAGARARPDVVRADTGGASRARRGRTRRRHGLRCDGAFLAREERALPKARVLLPYPRRGGQGSGQAQTRGRVLLRPRLPRHARRRRAGLRVLQAMEGAHWPPATDALAIVHTAGLLTHTILTRPTEETRPSAPLCGIRPRLGHLARPCAT